MRRRLLPLVLLYAVHHSPAAAADVAEVKMDRIVALAKTYFRDSAEVPMDVAVTTVVTGTNGKPKHRAQSTVRMVFHGYNLQSGKFSLRGNSGWFNTWALRDSMTGDMAAFVAPLFLVPSAEVSSRLEIRQPDQPGRPAIVTGHATGCEPFQLMPPGRFLFPYKHCGTEQVTLALESNEPVFQHYSFDSDGLPAPARVPYLGDVQILGFHADVDFQKGTLPGDPNPFLWPKETAALITTDKGKISIANRYSPRLPSK